MAPCRRGRPAPSRLDPPWQIFTEHFEIQTNMPLAEATVLGRRLEAFHDLFISLLADVLGNKLPLAQRFQDPKLTGEPPVKRHLVFYFASKQQFVDHLIPSYGSKISESLGFFDPPKKSSRGGRAPAYFYHDPEGQLPVEANLYHEVSHQLLFETAGSNAYTSNVGNYWVFEGLGTYFETVEQKPDGSLEVGGLVGARIEEAIAAIVDQHRGIPLAQFVALNKPRFMNDAGVRFLYQQAEALTVFLMQWHEGAYREGFFDYIRDAYRGRIKRQSGRTLEDRLGQPFSTLEAQFLAFLRDSRAQDQAPRSTPTATATKPASDGSIRTVPKSKPTQPASTGSIRTVPKSQ